MWALCILLSAKFILCTLSQPLKNTHFHLIWISADSNPPPFQQPPPPFPIPWNWLYKMSIELNVFGLELLHQQIFTSFKQSDIDVRYAAFFSYIGKIHLSTFCYKYAIFFIKDIIERK